MHVNEIFSQSTHNALKYYQRKKLPVIYDLKTLRPCQYIIVRIPVL